MANSTVCQSKCKNNSWTTAGQANDISSTHWLYEEAVIKSEARTAVVQLKSEA